MYEEHFGLKKRPFSEKVTGTDVFVGPQTAKTMAGFRKALAVQDAVVSVSGPVGTGKTTLVERALDAIGTRYKTIRVGRMQMNSSDVLESLLVVLGVQDRPTGTIQRFAALRKKLKELQDAETRVFILVEDAMRAGAETLAELEALTVADAGESDGASIVLMGDERLFDFMRDPQLVRLQQRIRQRHRIMPLCVAEMLGYLKHSFRMAGGDYERVFDTKSAELFHHLSDGIPRVANNLVESVLAAAAAKGMDTIPATFVASVASDEFGLSADGFDFSLPEPAAECAPEPVPVVDVAAEKAPEPEPVVDVVAEKAPEPEPVAEKTEPVVSKESQPVIVSADDAEQSTEESQDVPHLIQDTLPDLAILSKRYATLLQDDAEETPEVIADHDHADEELAVDAVPELEPEPTPEPDPAASLTPDVLPEPISKPEPVAAIIPELTPEPVPEPKPAAAAGPEGLAKPIPEPEPAAEIIPELEPEPEPSPEIVEDFAREFEPGPVVALESAAEIIPELVPEPDPMPEPVPMPEPEPVAKSIPELQLEPTPDVPAEPASEAEPPAEVAAEKSADYDVPEWDRDPTLAQLKPDLEALEQAMAFTHGAPLELKPDAPEPPEIPSDRVGEKEDIPEITLDKAIETGIQDDLIEEPSDIQPPKPAKKPDVELDRIAANIANAKTLDDVDDIMAETLFGTGISMIAAQITANPPSDESANDELQLAEEPSPEAAPRPEQAPAADQAKAADRPAEEISIETRSPMANAGMDLSASQRLKTVRALNADLHPSLREPEKAPGTSSPPAGNEPQPIEDQINTSITQTLKALKVPPQLMDDEPEEETKSGFFSRFRRS